MTTPLDPVFHKHSQRSNADLDRELAVEMRIAEARGLTTTKLLDELFAERARRCQRSWRNIAAPLTRDGKVRTCVVERFDGRASMGRETALLCDNCREHRGEHHTRLKVRSHGEVVRNPRARCAWCRVLNAAEEVT